MVKKDPGQAPGGAEHVPGVEVLRVSRLLSDAVQVHKKSDPDGVTVGVDNVMAAFARPETAKVATTIKGNLFIDVGSSELDRKMSMPERYGTCKCFLPDCPDGYRGSRGRTSY
jgi:hypothetical protein